MEIFTKTHLELGSVGNNSKVCGVFKPERSIKVRNIRTSCGCTKDPKYTDKGIEFCIKTGSRPKHRPTGSIGSKKVTLWVDYIYDGVKLSETLTASCGINY